MSKTDKLLIVLFVSALVIGCASIWKSETVLIQCLDARSERANVAALTDTVPKSTVSMDGSDIILPYGLDVGEGRMCVVFEGVYAGQVVGTRCLKVSTIKEVIVSNGRAK